ncbi:MAG TPA: T9SS type A sorting domain-containing protein, partial [Tenuifilaceae bacterium]|nr:T9SS type A sorting domain-containing protein [Tenuifilaceae bacterium]
MPNSLVSISATANPGYEFKKWTIAGDSISSANPLQYTVQAADVEIVGHFGWITNTPTTSIAGVMVFPNPFSNTLSINNASSVKSVTISNLIGQEVFKQTPANNVNFTINTHDFQRGIYLVTLEMLSGERIVKRIVKN